MDAVTSTVTLCVAPRLGVPSSVTITRNTFVDAGWYSSDTQKNTPLVGLMTAFVGAPSSVKRRLLAGSSASSAMFV